MNFLQICEQVAEEVNGKPLTFSSVALTGATALTDPFQRKVVRAVQTKYMEVLLASRYWKFLNEREIPFLTITAGVTEYEVPDYQSLDWKSLYLTKSGTTARWPIVREEYDSWQRRERAVTSSSGIPLYLIHGNKPDLWLFWPVPNDTYYLNGNIQYKPTQLEGSSDEPIWDEQYHELLVWLAIRHLESRVRVKEEVVSQLNSTEAQRNATSLWAAFCAHYLPSTQSCKPFV